MSHFMSSQVLDALNDIAMTASKNEKQAIVAQHINDPLFQKAAVFAYNPFITFGIKPPADAKGTGAGQFSHESGVFKLLELLKTRALTGNAARDALTATLALLDEKSGDLLIRIIRKDLRAGFSESTINKAKKGLLPEFPYMRCSLPKDAKLHEWSWEEGVLSQEKADGMFANGDIILSEDLTFTSRQGTPFPMGQFKNIVDEVRNIAIANTQFHGELVVERDGVTLPREIGNGILNSVVQGGVFAEGDVPVYLVWDRIPMSAVKPKGSHGEPVSRRVDHLDALTCEVLSDEGAIVVPASKHIRLIETRIVHSLAEAYAHYAEKLAEGKEGTVIKEPNAIWKDGTSKHQCKIKVEADVELEIVAVVPGKVGGKNEGRAGSLTCKSSCGELIVDVAIKNESMRDRVDSSNDEWIGKIMTVRGNSIMKPGASSAKHSMFLPRFVEDIPRLDKSEADSLELVRAQFDAVVTNAKRIG